MKVDLTNYVAGEFSVAVRKADGSIKAQLPTQPNLVTDVGLAALSFTPYTNTKNENMTNWYVMQGMCIGTGSTTPAHTDTTLVNLVAYHSNVETLGTTLEQPNDKHPHHVKVSHTRKFFFRGINNQNITEVGLCYYSGSVADARYALYTRALIKDVNSLPTSVTVLPDEVLEITYTFSQYYDIRQVQGEINLLHKNAVGDTQETEVFQYVLQPYAHTTNDPAYGAGINGSIYPTAFEVKDDEVTSDAPYDFSKWTAFDKSASNNEMRELLAKHAKPQGQSSNFAYPDESSAFSSTAGTHFQVLERANNAQRYRITVNYGAMNFANGIRALQFTTTYSSTKFRVNVVFANKTNGRGIMKKDTERFSFEVTIRVARYEELP